MLRRGGGRGGNKGFWTMREEGKKEGGEYGNYRRKCNAKMDLGEDKR